MRGIIAALIAVVSIGVAASAASAGQDKEWICHGTGSDTNPFVLINVPTNSAHFTKHLVDGTDKLPLEVDGGLTCGDEQSPPTPPFTGDITFTLIAAQCKAGEVGVPGFEVTVFVKEKFHHGELDSLNAVDGDGRDVSEQVLFTFPATCIPVVPGPAGAAGPAGPVGPAGPAGLPGASGQTVILNQVAKSCTSRRVYRFLVRKRYRLRLLTNVHASDSGANSVKVRKTRTGRYQVTADYRGKKVNGFNSQRHIKVTATVGRFRLAFNQNVDLCRATNGNQNAPSASGLQGP